MPPRRDRRALALDDRLSVSAFVASDEGFVHWSTPPDVIVVDASVDRLPETIRTIARVNPEPIVALGVPDDEQDVIAFAEAGVLGLLEREASIDDLVASPSYCHSRQRTGIARCGSR